MAASSVLDRCANEKAGMSAVFLDGRVTLHAGDCLDVVRSLPDASMDSVVTDPPYALVSISKRFGKPGAATAQHGRDGLYKHASAGFMGKSWDTGERAFAVEFWSEILRVLKPGGHVAAFSGTRTYHRLACAIEDAGFEIRDQLAWAYGSGFPKSHNVGRAVRAVFTTDRKMTRGEWRAAYSHWRSMAGRFAGWGTALKPAWEPIVLARKPLIGTVAANVLAYGTGAINVQACGVAGEAMPEVRAGQARIGTFERRDMVTPARAARWPANIVHDGSPEVVGAFPETHAAGSCSGRSFKGWKSSGELISKPIPNDSGSAARFFYTAKANSDDRIGSKHPTVKPVDLMQWLVRLITPPGGVVLDPFAGTGTTGEAAWREGFSAVLIEREADYRDDIARRMALATEGRASRKVASLKARGGAVADDHGPLFGEAFSQ